MPKVALITAAAKRIGRAIALELARAGYDIGLHFNRSSDAAADTARQIQSTGRKVALLPADLAVESAVAALPQRCVESLGALDAVVNNAAVFDRMPLNEVNAADWNRTIAVNLTAPAVLCRHAAPLLQPGGSVVNICDIHAERPLKNYLAYSASKAGLVTLTRALARTLAPRIRVNAVSPGVADWPEDYPDDLRRRIIERIPMHRAGTPQEVAAVVRFLICDASYVTGLVLAVDGGRSVAW